jgi:hypothetical protein
MRFHGLDKKIFKEQTGSQTVSDSGQLAPYAQKGGYS